MTDRSNWVKLYNYLGELRQSTCCEAYEVVAEVRERMRSMDATLSRDEEDDAGT